MKIKTPALWWSNAHICILCLRRKNYPHRVLWRILNKRLWCTPIYSNLTFWSIKVPNSQAVTEHQGKQKYLHHKKADVPPPMPAFLLPRILHTSPCYSFSSQSHLLLSHWFPVALAWEIRPFFEKTKNKNKNNKKKGNRVKQWKQKESLFVNSLSSSMMMKLSLRNDMSEPLGEQWNRTWGKGGGRSLVISAIPITLSSVCDREANDAKG